MEPVRFLIAKASNKGYGNKCILNGYWATTKIRGFFIIVITTLLFFISISVIFEAEYSHDIGNVLEITEPFLELKIYDNMEIPIHAK